MEAHGIAMKMLRRGTAVSGTLDRPRQEAGIAMLVSLQNWKVFKKKKKKRTDNKSKGE